MDRDTALEQIDGWLGTLTHLPPENHEDALAMALLQGLRVALLSPTLARNVYLNSGVCESFARDFIKVYTLESSNGLTDEEVDNCVDCDLFTESVLPSIATWDEPDVCTN